MKENIFIAGFGGQGIILAGNVLAYGCIYEGRNILAMVSYGAEMRGGTAKAMISVSDEEIDSPIVDKYDVGVIMNNPSLVKYIDTVKPGGLLLVNSSMVDMNTIKRKDLKIIPVDVTNLAIQMGNIKVANLIMMGVYIQMSTSLSKQSLLKALKKVFSKKKQGLYYINEKAFETGLGLELNMLKR